MISRSVAKVDWMRPITGVYSRAEYGRPVPRAKLAVSHGLEVVAKGTHGAFFIRPWIFLCYCDWLPASATICLHALWLTAESYTLERSLPSSGSRPVSILSEPISPLGPTPTSSTLTIIFPGAWAKAVALSGLVPVDMIRAPLIDDLGKASVVLPISVCHAAGSLGPQYTSAWRL